MVMPINRANIIIEGNCLQAGTITQAAITLVSQVLEPLHNEIPPSLLDNGGINPGFPTEKLLIIQKLILTCFVARCRTRR
jgi:hypothetical protein